MIDGGVWFSTFDLRHRCGTHRAGEVPLHQALHVQLRLQPRGKGHEVVDGQTLHDGLILLNDGPAAVLQDQQTDVSAQGSKPVNFLRETAASRGASLEFVTSRHL